VCHEWNFLCCVCVCVCGYVRCKLVYVGNVCVCKFGCFIYGGNQFYFNFFKSNQFNVFYVMYPMYFVYNCMSM